MKHIKLFQELNKSTYISAAKKLSELGGNHKKRAKELLKHGEDHGTEAFVNNLYQHEFELNAKWNEYSINDGGYQITDGKIKKTDYPQCNITITMYNDKGDKKSITIGIPYDEGEPEYDIMYLTFYDGEKYGDDMAEFKFSNRKDAMEFKKFVLDYFADNTEFAREIEIFKNVPINKLFK